MTTIIGNLLNNTLTGTSLDETIFGLSGDDVIDGAGGDDIIYGGDDNDEARGGNGSDVVYGGSGDDTLRGGGGQDFVYGGDDDDLIFQNNEGLDNFIFGDAGNDELNLNGSSAAWNINVSSNSGTSGSTSISFFLIETITATDFDDVITADATTDRVNGEDGNDTLVSVGQFTLTNLFGGDGNDTLVASNDEKTDRLFGGAGTNTYLFEDASGDFTRIFLSGLASANDTVLIKGNSNGDSFDLSEVDFFNIDGITFDMIGPNLDVTSELNPDQLDTVTDISSTFAVTGNNAAGSTEKIEIDLTKSLLNTDILDLSGWTFSTWGNQGELIEIIGSARDETIIGSIEADSVSGGSGNDTIDYIGGGDTLFGGLGNKDRLDIETSTGVLVDLSNGSGSHSGDALVLGGFELVYGGNGADTLISNAGANDVSLYGGSGNDTLQASGTSAADALFGGFGENTFLFDDASGVYRNDLFDGGTSGTDDHLLFQAQANGDHFDLDGAEIESIEGITFDAVGTNMDVTVELDPDQIDLGGTELSTSLDVTGNNETGSTEVIGIDLSQSIENTRELDLSGWTFSDWGDQGDHVSITGSFENDTITGSVWDDTINTGGGDDTVFWIGLASPLGDEIDGGTGNDTVDGNGTSFRATAVFDLQNGMYADGAFTETWSNFEHYNNGGSSGGAEQVVGTFGANTITTGGGDNSISALSGADNVDGGDGNDTIQGGLGNDTLIGGAGADSIDGGGDIDTADYSASSSTVIVRLDGTGGIGGDAEGDTLTNIENLIGSINRDFLIGDGNVNTLMGGGEADNLQGGAGADVLDGGDGFDFADYQEVTTTLTIDLLNFSNSSTVIQEDTLINIEAYAGAVTAKNIYNGQNGNEYFIGGILGDEIDGNDGADTLRSEAGNDTVNGGGGSDFIVGGLGDDTLSGGLADGAVDGFLFQDGHGNDVVTDFELGFDKLSWFSPTINALSDLTLSTSVNGWGLVTYGTSTVEVENVTQAQLNDVNNFFFF